MLAGMLYQVPAHAPTTNLTAFIRDVPREPNRFPTRPRYRGVIWAASVLRSLGVLLNFRDMVSRRSPSDRQHRPSLPRRSTCWAAIVIVAALLNLATPPTSAAQGTG